MAKTKEVVSPHQIQFFVERTGDLRLSNRIDTWDFGTIVVDFLTERSIWKEIPKEGQFLLIEAGEEENAYLLDRTSWQKEEYVDLEEGDYDPFACAIIVFPYDLIEISKKGYEEIFVRAISFLNQDSGGFFVLEKVGVDADLKWREQSLKDVGLAKVKIFTSQKKEYNQLVWSGRLHKERAEPEPIDMTEPGSAYYSRSRKKWGLMVSKYKQTGYRVIEPEKSPLLARIKSSKYPYFDLGLIDTGVGVKLQSTCGCVWDVPFKHEWERVLHCPDENCSGKPKFPGILYNLSEPIEVASRCYDCSDTGTKRLKRYFRKSSKENYVELLSETYCLHCGLKSTSKSFWVRRDQIVGN